MGNNPFVMRGMAGELREGSEVAAELGPWTLQRDGPEWSVSAELRQQVADRLIPGGSVDLCLNVGAKVWRWREVQPQILESRLSVHGDSAVEVIERESMPGSPAMTATALAAPVQLRPAVPDGKRRAPQRIAHFDLDFEGYQGWFFEARTSMNMEEYRAYTADVNAGRIDAESSPAFVAGRLTAWNFVDADGVDLPANAEGIGQVEIALITEMNRLIWDRINSLPLAFSATSKSGSDTA